MIRLCLQVANIAYGKCPRWQMAWIENIPDGKYHAFEINVKVSLQIGQNCVIRSFSCVLNLNNEFDSYKDKHLSMQLLYILCTTL